MPKLDGEAWLACLTNLSSDQLDRPHLWPSKPASSDLQRVREALVDSLKAAPASATMAHVEFLRSRYRARPAEPAHLADADARLWIEALAHWPADVAEAACYAWMVAEKPFPPSVPGELLPYGDPIVARRSALLWRVERMLAALERAGDDPEPEHSFGANLRALAAQVRGALGSKARPSRVPGARGRDSADGASS
jgi:hypothetical protein